MESFLEKKWSIGDLQKLIDNKEEESLTLEFKRAAALVPAKRDEIAKDISAFANSVGGVLIYGMEEKEHVAKEIDFIDGDKFDKERLERIINDSIQRRIIGIEIDPIRVDDDIKKTIYVVKIPQSEFAPHMVSKTGKYYQRYNFETQHMLEYQVRDKYFSKSTPECELYVPDVRSVGGAASINGLRTRSFEFILGIKNISKQISHNSKIEVEFPSSFRGYVSSYDLQKELKKAEYERNDVSHTYKVQLVNKSPIFPTETQIFETIPFKADNNNIDILRRMKIKIKMYYEGGSQELLVDFDNQVFL